MAQVGSRSDKGSGRTTIGWWNRRSSMHLASKMHRWRLHGSRNRPMGERTMAGRGGGVEGWRREVHVDISMERKCERKRRRAVEDC